MILGIGTDIVAIERIQKILNRFPNRFIARAFTKREIEAAEEKHSGHRAAFFAKRFAAKEACAKALGTGFRDGLFLQDIEILNDRFGRPSLMLHGEGDRRLAALARNGLTPEIHISLSDEKAYAQAFVVIEAVAQQ